MFATIEFPDIEIEKQKWAESLILHGDTRDLIKELPNNFYSSCITSPPYWGKRDYGYNGQIGAEESLDEYIDDLVKVFQVLKKKLKADGTFWLNIGDSYTSGNRTWRAEDKKNSAREMSYRPRTPNGLKPKDLIGIPWRLAFALQADGWYLRSDIIWYKPNCQPESVRDRPTQSHEYIFLFSKSEDYYYDYESIKEPAVEKGKTRNKRSVWQVNTEPFADAHFATFPEDLIRPIITASSKENEFVIDPFFGSGTVGVVCNKLKRKFHGIELKQDYINIAERRLKMPDKISYPTLSADLQVGFHYRLKSIKDLYFHEALSKTVRSVKISDIDFELNKYVKEEALQKLASLSLRGEVIFPTPLLLNTNPFLVGYYRLLLGFSQKEFYSKGPFGTFKSMEENGILSRIAINNLEIFCVSLIKTAESLVAQMGDFNIATLTELQLLTVGPQFRGSMNNEYGQIATQKTFGLIKEFVTSYVLSSTPDSIEIKNDSGRIVEIKFSSDPDIEIIEKLSTGARGLISIEIKGGKDISNIHNRIGEAEKSHQKAKQRGYFEFMTIISVDIEYSFLRSESPTTSHFFHLDKISDKNSVEYNKFKE